MKVAWWKRGWRSLYKVVALVMVLVSVSACGNIVYTRISGRVGVRNIADGSWTVEVQTCGLPVDSLQIDGAFTGVGNAAYGEWVRDDPVSGRFTFDPTDPPDGWRETVPFSVPPFPEKMVMILVTTTKLDAEVSMFRGTVGKIESTPKDQILTDEPRTEDEFSSCDAFLPWWLPGIIL